MITRLDFLKENVSQLKVCVVHGKMKSRALDDAMSAFYDREFDILVATSIIESGLDIPSVNTLIVYRAEMFGLAQLHQLRGRIVRGNLQGNCVLIYSDNLSESTLTRLSILKSSENDFEIEKSNIVTMSDASYALQNYYKFMVDHIGSADQNLADDVKIQNYGQDVSDEEHEMANEEVKALFEKYIEKLTESNKEAIQVEEDRELTEEELDTLPCSDTKH